MQSSDMKKIAIVGPVPPIRSGVARHTLAAARALSARVDTLVRTYSFRRQYPAFLYPGVSERSTDPVIANAAGAEFSIDGVNPLTWYSTVAAVRAWRPDLIVVPAWTFVVAPSLGWIARRSRHAGAECCMIVHNAFDHENVWWKTRLSLWQLAQADRFVTHNAVLADTLTQRFPGNPVGVFPHPVFDDFPAPENTKPRTAALELLFFGLVRPYKGLELALEAIARSGRRDLRLTIAGEFWSGLAETRLQIARLGISELVELIPRYVTDAEAAELFARADAVILPYRSVTGSGVIPTAYHYGRAVIATDLPGLAAVISDGETGWLTPPDDADALAAVIRGLDREATTRAGSAAKVYGATLSWERFAELVRGDL